MLNKFSKFTLCISIVGIIFLTTIYILTSNVIFQLKGEKLVKLQLNESYVDNGIVATIFKYDISKYVKTSNDLDIKHIGLYSIKYSLNFIGHNYILTRNIEVIDSIPPTIKLNGEKEIKLYVGDTYTEEGATAIDNYDNDLTESIKIEGNVDTSKEGKYEINYLVEDSSGNKNSVSRVITIETKKESIIEKKIDNTPSYNMNDPIVKYIKEHNYNVSIGYYNLVTGKEYLYQENKIYYGASLIKTLDAIYLYDKNLVNDSIKSYINKAISISDNDAHQYLVDYIGKQNLKNYGIDLGAKNTLTGGDYYYGNTTVRDQLIYLKKLYNITNHNEELKSFFINDYGNYIKINDLITMHKYGYYAQYYHDVGIIFDTNPYIIIILTNHGNDNKKEIINDLSKLMYKYHLNQL